jgi:hypothetical protein
MDAAACLQYHGRSSTTGLRPKLNYKTTRLRQQLNYLMREAAQIQDDELMVTGRRSRFDSRMMAAALLQNDGRS